MSVGTLERKKSIENSDNVILLHTKLDAFRGERKRSTEILKSHGTTHETQDTPLVVLEQGIFVFPHPNVSYVEGPLSIDAISEKGNVTSREIKSLKKFVFLDSITTVLLYNSLERTINFSQFLIKTLKQIDVVGIVVSVAKGFANTQLVKKLSIIANEVINLRSKEKTVAFTC